LYAEILTWHKKPMTSLCLRESGLIQPECINPFRDHEQRSNSSSWTTKLRNWTAWSFLPMTQNHSLLLWSYTVLYCAHTPAQRAAQELLCSCLQCGKAVRTRFTGWPKRQLDLLLLFAPSLCMPYDSSTLRRLERSFPYLVHRSP